MSPKEAKVGVFEDNFYVRECLRLVLPLERHRIVFEAATKKDAVEAIESGKLSRLGAQVVLVDGSYEDSKFQDGRDGEAIIGAIKKFAPEIKTVGISAFGDLSGADVNLGKSFDIEELNDNITKL